MNEICVVHLARKKNGIESFRNFIQSYANHPGGKNHDFLILFKGFHEESELIEYRKLLNGFSYHYLFVNDWGYDLSLYFLVARKFNYQYFCFLNSFSIILEKNWLLHLYSHISLPGVGLVGTTASYQNLPSHFRKIISSSSSLKEKIKKSLLVGICHFLKFDPFPNYHIRTNGFMISRALMNKIKKGFLFLKIQTLALESGKKSLTKQVLKMNLKVLVVGKDGKGYEKEEWPISNTFRHSEQENLLIGDKHTDFFNRSDKERKMMLTQETWGDDVVREREKNLSKTL